ncbi:MAG: cupin domain-containing protein, partial [Spirochaetales bacterium]|nr:cupin domain-containing protein [Spirochaetales bacterium]
MDIQTFDQHTRHLETDIMLESAGISLRVMRIPAHGSQSIQHSHDFQELVVILSGHGKHEIGTDVYDIEAGDVFVILGDTTHGFTKTENLSLINILFDPDQLRIPRSDIGNLPGYHALFTIEPQLRAIGRYRNHLRLTTDDLGHTAETIAEIEEELLHKTGGFQFMAVSHLMRLLGFLSRRFTEVQLNPSRPI